MAHRQIMLPTSNLCKPKVSLFVAVI
jgi:hypothetical protein